MTNDLMSYITDKIPKNSGIKVPPNVFVEMEGEMLEYQAGEFLKVRFPIKEKYQNPFGYMQGGIIVAAVDNTIGPLSMLEAPPSVTSQLNTTYIRPIGPEQKYMTVTGTVLEKTKRNLHMEAEVHNEAGKLCVKCFAIFTVI